MSAHTASAVGSPASNSTWASSVPALANRSSLGCRWRLRYSATLPSAPSTQAPMAGKAPATTGAAGAPTTRVMPCCLADCRKGASAGWSADSTLAASRFGSYPVSDSSGNTSTSTRSCTAARTKARCVCTLRATSPGAEGDWAAATRKGVDSDGFMRGGSTTNTERGAQKEGRGGFDDTASVAGGAAVRIGLDPVQQGQHGPFVAGHGPC